MKVISFSASLIRYLIASIGLAFALGLSGCGGGSDVAATPIAESKKNTVMAKFAAETDPAKVVAVSQISERRISRTVFEYVFNVTVLNGSLLQTDVQATLASVGTGTTVVDGLVVVGNMAANARVTSADTITLRHDRTHPFDLSKLVWRVSGTVPLTAQPISVRGVVPERVVTLSTGEQIVMSDLLVVLDESVSVTAAEAMFAQIGGTIVGRIPVAHLYQVEVPQANTEAKLRAVRSVLASRSDVLEVSFNGMSQTSASSTIAPSTVYYPDDQYVRRENDSNSVPNAAGYQRLALDAMNAGTAWKALQTPTPLNRVVVGVIDGGFSQKYTNPATRAANEITFDYLYGPSDTDNSPLPGFDPTNPDRNVNHGMHVAGIIAAKGNNGLSGGNVAGLAWQAPMELHGARSDSTFISNLAHVARLTYAGAKVINYSMGSAARLSLDEVCKQAGVSTRLISRLAKNYGDFIFVLAAGNHYDKAYLWQPLALLFQPQETPTCPLFVGTRPMSSTDLGIVKDHIIIVANADTTTPGMEALFTGGTKFCPTLGPVSPNCGGSNFGVGVEIAAPGVDILSLGFEPKYQTAPLSSTGTSMAAPQVTAALALAWSIQPTLSSKRAKEIVIGTASVGNTARRTVADYEGRQYPLLDLNDVVINSLLGGPSIPPPAPNAIAPLVIYATCKFDANSAPGKLWLNVRITNTLNAVEDEGLLESSFTTVLAAGSYTLMVQEPTPPQYLWDNQRPTKSIPFELLNDPSGNVRIMHVQFSAPTSSACSDTSLLPPPTVTGVNVSIPPATSASLAIDLTPTAIAALGGSGVGSFAYETAALSGRNRPAAKFSAGYLRVPNSAAMQFTDGATFDLWARIDSNTGTYMTLIAKSHDRNGVGFLAARPNAASGVGFGYVHSASYDPSWAFNTCQTFPAIANIAVGSWFRMTIAVSSATGWRHYVNKQLVHSCPNARPSFTTMNTQDLFIGRFSDNFWYPLNGAVSDIRIYQKALTAAEIAALP